MAFQPLVETGSIWQMMHPGAHAHIYPLIAADATTAAALQAATAPGATSADAAKLVDTIARQTGNSVGQALVHQGLNPEDANLSVYRGLAAGTEAAISAAISALSLTDLGVQQPGTTKDAKLGAVFAISRYTGRCIGQAVEGNLLAVIKKIVP